MTFFKLKAGSISQNNQRMEKRLNQSNRRMWIALILRLLYGMEMIFRNLSQTFSTKSTPIKSIKNLCLQAHSLFFIF